MPCWQVATTSVEFKAKHSSLIMEAARSIGFNPLYNERSGTIRMNDRVTIDLRNQTAQVRDNDFETLNKLKRAYSRTVVQEVARRKKWAVKMTGENKMRLRRY